MCCLSVPFQVTCFCFIRTFSTLNLNSRFLPFSMNSFVALQTDLVLEFFLAHITSLLTFIMGIGMDSQFQFWSKRFLANFTLKKDAILHCWSTINWPTKLGLWAPPPPQNVTYWFSASSSASICIHTGAHIDFLEVYFPGKRPYRKVKVKLTWIQKLKDYNSLKLNPRREWM